MMKAKLGFVAVLAGLALAATAPSAVSAQATKAKPKAMESKATANRGAGADANIKNDDVKNKAGGADMAVPPRKGGAKTRGAAVGTLHIDNRTSWYIRIYVDGDYRGTIAPMGDWYLDGGCDSYRLYAVANFDNGSTYSFGPVDTNGSCGDQTWTLRR
jgi:hypothetical protein